MSPIDSFGRARTVLLLGGTSDIGQAIVKRMVDGGVDTVVLAGRDTESPLPDLGVRTDRRFFDAADIGSHVKFFAETFDDHPDIDTIVFAFGVLHDQDEVERNPGVGVEMVEVNYLGTASTLLRSADHLERRGAGQLVVLSSVAAVTPRRSNFVYGSSKAGVDFLARGLAGRMSGGDVHVLIVRPGFVRTKMTEDMTPRPFSVSADTVARAVVDALARRANVVWVPGILRWVMALVRILPSPIVARLED